MGVTLVLSLALGGCTTFGFDVRSFPNPVLVSPILRVGDRGPEELTAAPISNVHGEASSSAASGAGVHYEERGGDLYQVSKSSYGSEMSDDIFRSLADGTGRRSDVFVVVDALTASDLTHMSMIGWVAMEFSIEGRVYEQYALEGWEEGR